MVTLPDPLPQDAPALISSDKVEGTDVCRADGEKIGEISQLLIEKRSGKVVYAVLSFGGFFGIGEDYYPVPWEKLRYNTHLDAYEIDIDEEQLANAPKLASTGQYDWSHEDGRRISNYYGTPSIF